MQRREFIGLVGGVAAWPVAARAQQPKMPVIGFVAFTVESGSKGPYLKNVRKGLAEYGYVEGQNYRFEILETNFKIENRPIMYRKLVDQKVTLIITPTTQGVVSARAATQSIPVVFAIASDPVESGFVASLHRPGGNITGVYTQGTLLLGKLTEWLHEMLPAVAKFALLTDPGNTTLSRLQIEQVEAAAKLLGLEILNVRARNAGEFTAAFETAVGEGSGGMIIGTDNLFNRPDASAQLVALAAGHKLPTTHADDLAVKAGGLISYSPDYEQLYRTVGRYAGRILKGEKPADMPVQLSTRTRLIINVKTAKMMGITVPTSLLVRADEVVE